MKGAEKYIPGGCFMTARGIVNAKMGVGLTDSGIVPSGANAFRLLKQGKRFKDRNVIKSGEENTIFENQHNFYDGVNMIDNLLKQGISVVVGVFRMKHNKENNTYWYQTTTPNENPYAGSPTHHFVTIVGKGHDSEGDFYYFYEVGTGNPANGTNPNNKLYIKRNMIVGATAYNSDFKYIVTEIRKTKAK